MPATIRSRLTLLVLATLLPGLVAGAWGLASAFEAERRARERTLAEAARAVVRAVDGEFARRATIAQLLARSPALDAGGRIDAAALQTFDGEARRAMHGLDGWVELRAPGRLLLDTRWPPGADRPGAAAATLAASPQRLPLQDNGTPQAHVAWLEPVQREGATVLNLWVTLRPAELQRSLGGQPLPGRAGSTAPTNATVPVAVAVLDDRGTLVAHHPGDSTDVGHRAGGDTLARLGTPQAGWVDSVMLDGVRSAAFSQTSASGWRVVTALPHAQFAGPLPGPYPGPLPSSLPGSLPGPLRHIGPAGWLGIAGSVLLALALAAALGLSRRITRALNSLKLAAASLPHSTPLKTGTTGLAECDDVAQALAGASQALLQQQVETDCQAAAAVDARQQAEQERVRDQRSVAVGRLAASMAHDFNNLLGVIGNSSYLIQRLAADRPGLQPPLAATTRAVESGSRLTRHLLRVATQRPMQPQPVVLTQFLQEMDDILRCLLGKRVKLVLRVAADSRPVLVDPGELELALIHLALHARDTMPDGGEWQLQAGNVSAGGVAAWGDWLTPSGDDQCAAPSAADLTLTPWVEIAVRHGMPAGAGDAAGRASKVEGASRPVDDGMDSGLRQVRAFCVQAGGVARIDADVDAGGGAATRVRLLLPALSTPSLAAVGRSGGHAASAPTPDTAITEPVALAVSVAGAAGSAPDIAGSRVLLVEDNAELAAVTEALLRAHGASVERASDAPEALRLLDTHGPMDLVLSDVAMAGPLDGLGLARQLRREQPELPVILISADAPAGDVAGDFRMLRKPCLQADLLAAIRGALGRRHSRA